MSTPQISGISPTNGDIGWRSGSPAYSLTVLYLAIEILGGIALRRHLLLEGIAAGSPLGVFILGYWPLVSLSISLSFVLLVFPTLRQILWARLAWRREHRPWLWMLLSIGLMVAVMTSILVAVSLGFQPKITKPVLYGPDPLWFTIQAVVIKSTLIPLVEELAFRGVIEEDLKRWIRHPFVRALIVAALFALAHAGGIGVLALYSPVIFSLFASYALHRTGSIGIAVLVHGSWNGALWLLTSMI